MLSLQLVFSIISARYMAKDLMTLGCRMYAQLEIPLNLPILPVEMDLARGQSKLEMLLYNT